MKVVIAGPSGAGKTTIISTYLQNNNQFTWLKTYTTRSPRSENDFEYHFVNNENFSELINKGFFFEYEYVFGNYYGVPNQILNMNNVFLIVDVYGAQKLKNIFKDLVTVMIIPPSYQELKNRLQKRGCTNLSERLQRIKTEMQFANNFDFLIMNEDVISSVNILTKIIEVHNHKNQCLKHIQSELYVEGCEEKNN